MNIGEIIWGVLLAIGIAFELWAIRYRPGWTLSEITRRVFHTSTIIGRVIFSVVWFLVFGWFLVHILTG